jgi:hypothetical protein
MPVALKRTEVIVVSTHAPVKGATLHVHHVVEDGVVSIRAPASTAGGSPVVSVGFQRSLAFGFLKDGFAM